MKVLRLSSFLLLAFILLSATMTYVFISPVQAANIDYGQKWYLIQGTQLSRTQPTTNQGSVGIAPQGSQYWLSDVTAQSDVTFDSGTWVVVLKTDFTNFSARVGGTANPGGNFYHDVAPDLVQVSQEGELVKVKITYSTSFTISNGDWLTLKLTNNNLTDPNDSNAGWFQVILRDGSAYLATPESNPVLTVPELSAGVLLGIGLAGLGSYAIIRSRKPTRVNIG